jgi:hypothetical protein
VVARRRLLDLQLDAGKAQLYFSDARGVGGAGVITVGQ